jgi:nicotinate phosphoribosyltransferase
VDGFGVGAAISTARDVPSIGAVYKLVEVERGGQRVPVAKDSPGKATYPGRKQVWRRFDGGTAVEDVIELADALPPPATNGAAHEPLLARVMHGGRREQSLGSAAQLQARHRVELARLPPEVRRLAGGVPYLVRIGPALARMIDTRR